MFGTSIGPIGAAGLVARGAPDPITAWATGPAGVGNGVAVGSGGSDVNGDGSTVGTPGGAMIGDGTMTIASASSEPPHATAATNTTITVADKIQYLISFLYRVGRSNDAVQSAIRVFTRWCVRR